MALVVEKTAATDRFATYDIDIIDADSVARDVVQPGTLGLNKIVEHFGDSILLASGELNRAKLRELIFSSKNDKIWLEKLLHPLIREKMLADLQSARSPYTILSAPLLFENDLDTITSKTLLIDCEANIQIQRIILRDNISEAQANTIINQQMSREKKLKRADDIITNNGTLTELHEKIDHYHHQLLNQI